jgi:antitoxin component YwqK of YwqJK toxin-antitoxin module
MKNTLILLLLVCSTALLAQQAPMVAYTTYHASGAAHITAFQMNGQFHGKYMEFDENGQILAVGQYEEGVKVGTWSVRAANGKSFYALVYRDDRIQSAREFAFANDRE